MIELIRTDTSDEGTNGIILLNGSPLCVTIEPPDRDNQPNISCIPEGEYKCVWHRSPKYGMTYHVTNVEGRSRVLIHPGNYAGDKEKGFKTHSHGCILLGTRRGVLGDQKAVLASKVAVRKFTRSTQRKDFTLRIR